MSFPTCPRCGTQMKPCHKQVGGENGIWVDDGWLCPTFTGCGRHWSKAQVEGHQRRTSSKTQTEQWVKAEIRRRKRAQRLQGQIPEVTP